MGVSVWVAFVSSIVHDMGIRRLGSLRGEVFRCCCSSGCVFIGVLLGVLRLGACVRPFGGVGVVGWGDERCAY